VEKKRNQHEPRNAATAAVDVAEQKKEDARAKGLAQLAINCPRPSRKESIRHQKFSSLSRARK